jgi:hypothetical protein
MDVASNPWLVAPLALAIVFVGLGLMSAALFLLRATYQRLQAASPTVDEGLDPEVLAVLSAAAHVALGGPVKIHRVHVHRERGGEAWAAVGRMDVMVSHRVVPKR